MFLCHEQWPAFLQQLLCGEAMSFYPSMNILYLIRYEYYTASNIVIFVTKENYLRNVGPSKMTLAAVHVFVLCCWLLTYGLQLLAYVISHKNAWTSENAYSSEL